MINYTIGKKSKRVNRGVRPTSFPSSCVKESRWNRTVRVVPEDKSDTSVTNANVSDYHIQGNYLRRQENLITKFELDIPARKEYNCEMAKHTVTSGISEDFSKNSLDIFEFKEDHFRNNFLRAREFVNSLRKSRHHNPKHIAWNEVEYLKSLEKFNICRNCKQCIKAKSAKVGERGVYDGDVTGYEKFIAHSNIVWQLLISNLVLNDVKIVMLINALSQDRPKDSVNYVGITFGFVEAHYEVYWDVETQAMRYREVEAGIRFNSKCSCMYQEVREKERMAERGTRASKIYF